MSDQNKANKKALFKARDRSKREETDLKNKPPKEKRWWQLGNQRARKWSDAEIVEIAAEINRLSQDTFSIAGIIASLEIKEGKYYDLVKRYPVVSEAHDLAKSRIASKAWDYGFNAAGFPNILQMAIRYHDKPFREDEKEGEKEQAKALEHIKGDERIREKRELMKVPETGERYTPAMLILMAKMAEKKALELFEKGDDEYARLKAKALQDS
jgi:hypothetical protein